MGPDSGLTTKILPTEQILIVDKIIRTVDDRSTEDQINSSIETTKID